MELKDIYAKVVNLQKIAWRGDDLMEQDDLCELQDKLADLALAIACQLGKSRELAKEFPWLYRVTVKGGQS